ncbi:MAG: diaminopimelate epimerase [Synergistaceae bacterium]|nr:diaminopimelate epimerase [Synergistaceae bacterium]
MTRFTKVHGNGNDFIVIDNREGRHSAEDLSRFARRLCRRKFSIGADGLLVVEKSNESTDMDFVMRLFNADGSEAEMCGNGARALARYAFEKKLAGEDMCFTTLAGPIRARVEPPYAELDMGDISLAESFSQGTLRFRDLEFPFFFLTVGVPHCVLFLKDYDALDTALKAEAGRAISHDSERFPEGSNVSFAERLPGDEIRMVTYERGVEELTESCGTGCVAASVLAFVSESDSVPCAGGLSRRFRVHNPGGVNEVRLSFAPDGRACHAWLKGRTSLVAEGEILEDAWL